MAKSILLIFLLLSLQLFFIFQLSSEDLKITSKQVVYDSQKNIKGFLAQPEKAGKYPGIILIHEWWELTDYVKSRAVDLAKLGYVALAVDLYDGRLATNPDEAAKLSTEVSKSPEKALSNLTMALGHLKSLAIVDPARLASIGWCFGGGWSYQTARNDLGVKAAVIYYGAFNSKDDFSKMRAVTLGNFGEKDQTIKVEKVKEFEPVLKSLNSKNELYIYPNAAHAFDTKNGANFNKEASELAWSRTLNFLKKYL